MTAVKSDAIIQNAAIFRQYINVMDMLKIMFYTNHTSCLQYFFFAETVCQKLQNGQTTVVPYKYCCFLTNKQINAQWQKSLYYGCMTIMQTLHIFYKNMVREFLPNDG
ncbi:hypothetical protein ACF0H5_019650 [Mactra antiquata]